MALLPFFYRDREQEVETDERIVVGNDVAVVCSDFPELVVRGFVVQADIERQWALVQVWYFDEWAGGYRQLFTWEPVENMRRLDCFLAEGRNLDDAILYKQAEAAYLAAS